MGGWSAKLITALDHWLAFCLLAFVGGGMIRDAFAPSEFCQKDATVAIGSLLSMALATSIDALVVGASFALVGKNVLPMALFSGIFTALVCAIGIYLGRFVGCRFGQRLELLGGVLLLLIGLNILISHLMDHGCLQCLNPKSLVSNGHFSVPKF